MGPPKHITIMDHLRGLAALAVVLFHFTAISFPSLLPNPLVPFFSQGYLGVQVFFVISGFVIPYALHRSSYALAGIWTFLKRRWVRIAPPAYLAAMMMIAYYLIAVAIIGNAKTGWVFPGFGATAILSNLTFTSEYFEPGTYNFVYWTLTAEFEFYLYLGLAYPLLVMKDRPWVPLTLLVLTLSSSFIDGPIFFGYSAYFVMGMALFLERQCLMGRMAFFAVMLISSVVAWTQDQPLGMLVGLATGVLIHIGPSITFKPTKWLGDISYSLYITHIPVAAFLESGMRRIIPPMVSPELRVLLIMLYVALALVFAGIFHRLIERPFMLVSKKIGIGKDRERSTNGPLMPSSR